MSVGHQGNGSFFKCDSGDEVELPVRLNFDDKGLIPAIVQDAHSGEVLMLAYMNRYSLDKTLDTGYTHFWSRSRNCLWKKGGTSGHVQRVIEISYDCDQDALLVRVEQNGPACHTGERSCFFRKLPSQNQGQFRGDKHGE